MPKYSDIVKKVVIQSQPVDSGDEPIIFVDRKPSAYQFRRPPAKGGGCNYDRWEYSYFAYLMEMYKILCEGEMEWDPPSMYDFFQFIYYTSSGKISANLEKLTEEQEEAYSEYMIKRNIL
jgi:hypothetical protein